jgi:hypothetical protein
LPDAGWGVHVVGITSDGGMYHTIRRADGTWFPFGNVKGQSGDPGAFKDVAVAHNQYYVLSGTANGVLDVLGITTDGQILYTFRRDDGSWFSPFSNIKQTADPGSVSVNTAIISDQILEIELGGGGGPWF